MNKIVCVNIKDILPTMLMGSTNQKELSDKKIPSYIGNWVVKFLISKRFGIKLSDVTFSYNEYGKPNVPWIDFHFNISHCGEWVVVALSSLEVGVDVERVRPINMNQLQHILTLDERIFWNQSEDKLQTFFKIWTLKESYIKRSGEGLSLPLYSFSVLSDQQAIDFIHFSLSDHYYVSICQEKNAPFPSRTTIYPCTFEWLLECINNIDSRIKN